MLGRRSALLCLPLYFWNCRVDECVHTEDRNGISPFGEDDLERRVTLASSFASHSFFP